MDGIKVEPKLEMTGTKVEPKALRKVFVGGLNLKTTEETFKDHFNQFSFSVIQDVTFSEISTAVCSRTTRS